MGEPFWEKLTLLSVQSHSILDNNFYTGEMVVINAKADLVLQTDVMIGEKLASFAELNQNQIFQHLKKRKPYHTPMRCIVD